MKYTKGEIGVNAREGEFHQSLQNLAEAEAVHCPAQFRWLKTVARVLPATGVLGSLLGAVSAFDAVSKAGQVDPRILAAGVVEMLITDITGLLFAVVFHIVRSLLESAVERRSLRLGDQPSEASG